MTSGKNLAEKDRNLDDQEYLNAKKEDYWLGGTKQPPTDSAQLKKKI